MKDRQFRKGVVYNEFMSSHQANKKILLTGVTGLIGKALGHKLVQSGWELVVLGRKTEAELRSTFPFPCRYYQWQEPSLNPPPIDALSGIRAVIHLMGEPLTGRRWTNERKKSFVESRVNSTRQLVAALKTRGIPLEVFISASAIGVYGDRGSTILDEQSTWATTNYGEQDFLSHLCQDWERESQQMSSCRSVQVRFGLVLSHHGGFLAKIIPVFRSGLGGRLSDGQHWMSWIHLDDVVRVLEEVLVQPVYVGPVNAVAPHPVTNQDFTRELARALKVKAFLPVPRWALNLALGEMSNMVLASQRVLPRVLLDHGFQFLFPDLESALNSLDLN